MSKVKSVLLAEDNANDLELALEALAGLNLPNEIAVARDGGEALDYLYCRGKFENRPNGDPVLVLLDIKMPKVDGMEVLRTIKGDGKLKTVPVVILTSSREERDLIEGYQLGVNAYVVKPVKFSEFIDCIKQLGTFWTVLNEPPPMVWRA